MSNQILEFTYGINKLIATHTGNKIPNVPAADLNREAARILGLILPDVMSNTPSGVIESKILGGTIEFTTHPSRGFTYRFKPSKQHIVTMDFGVPADGIKGTLKRRDMINDLYAILYDKMDHNARSPQEPTRTSQGTPTEPTEPSLANPEGDANIPQPSTLPVEDQPPPLEKYTRDKADKAKALVYGLTQNLNTKMFPPDGKNRFLHHNGISVLITNIEDGGRKSIKFIKPTATKDPANRHPTKYLAHIIISNYDIDKEMSNPLSKNLFLNKLKTKAKEFVIGKNDGSEPRIMAYKKLSEETWKRLASKMINSAIQRSNTKIASTGNGDDVMVIEYPRGTIKVITTRQGNEFKIDSHATPLKDKTAAMLVHLDIPTDLKKMSKKNEKEIEQSALNMASNGLKLRESTDYAGKMTFESYYNMQD